ncbi:hypothetical protein ACUTR7_14820 [Delftia sp. NA_296.1]|uniref:hypothetical protein n=1 Tax=Delftia sp. NA_296.1 TaxID=3415648 RepID=UPI004045BCAB
MAAQRYLSEMTAAKAVESIEAALDKVSKDLDQTPASEWDSQPVRELLNREQELHAAIVVLRDLEGHQGAFAPSAKDQKAPAALNAAAIAEAVCQRVAELPDRNSPEDWPEAMLVTGTELIDLVTCEITQALTAAPQAPEVDGLALIERQHPKGMTGVHARQLFRYGWSAGEIAEVAKEIRLADQAKGA